jgi:predicted RNase H-like nuclease (RuvC/YqgF family)
MDSLTADWFSFFNIPTGKDMKEVHTAIEELTEKNRILETEMGELKTALEALENRLQQLSRDSKSQ